MKEHIDGESNLAVIDPAITEVMDMQNGRILPVNEVIGSDYEKLIQLRSELPILNKDKMPRYICPLCHVAVYLVCRTESRHFFFRHTIEDGRCPAHTKGRLSEAEINARKYNGAKESEAHKQMKEFIEKSLKSDMRFRDIAVEQVWRGQELGKWRKPDISTKFNNETLIAFEIQLSTTFLRVIVERKEFYSKEGALLCWIFKDVEEDKPRLMQDDIFYNNNRNLFSASQETYRISTEQQKFHLQCYYSKPTINESQEIVNTWEKEIVPFEKLILDHEKQRIFFFDYEREKQELVRKYFESCWLKKLSKNLNNNENELEWQKLKLLLKKCDVELPKFFLNLYHLLNILYSVKHGKPIGYRFQKLIQVAHLVEHKHKEFLWTFGEALQSYSRSEQIDREDSSRKWKAKVDNFKPKLKVDEQYKRDESFYELISFLFPELNKKHR